MSTKSGRTFPVGETSAPIDPNLKDTLNTLIARIDQMDQRLQEFRDQIHAYCRDLVTQIERLETNRRRTTEENEYRTNSRSSRHERPPPYNTEDPGAQYIKSIKVNAPFFDRRLDLQAHINLQLTMDHCFRWHDMSECRKF